MKTISIVNLKGGVGKTVTTVNMAAQLAARGKRVIVIDADPQANATSFLLKNVLSEVDGTLADVLAGDVDCYDDVLYPTTIPCVNLIPADISLIEADIASVRNGAGVKRLADMIECIEEDNGELEQYGEPPAADYVLIDCPPSFTAASISAIAASDEVIIPVKIDAFSVSGTRELLAQIDGVRTIKPGIKVAGILITMWHKCPAVIQGAELLRKSDIPVFKTCVRRSDKVDESTFTRQALREYSPTSSAGRDYSDFVDEYLEKEAEKNG